VGDGFLQTVNESSDLLRRDASINISSARGLGVQANCADLIISMAILPSGRDAFACSRIYNAEFAAVPRVLVGGGSGTHEGRSAISPTLFPGQYTTITI